MRRITLLAAAALIACAGTRPGSPALQVATNPACDPGRVPQDDEQAWIEVRGDGFTFCVPSAWTPIGQRQQRWRSATVDFWWEDDPFESRVGVVAPARGRTNTAFGTRAVTETIDGATVRLEIEDIGADQLWSASAAWLEPSLRFYASARTASAAAEALGAFRSVRFKR